MGGKVCQGDGASWQQGEDRWRLDGEGSGQDQNRKDCKQKGERPGQEIPVDCSSQEGTRGIEDQGLRRVQEGHTSLRESEGVLQSVSAACLRRFWRVEHLKASALGVGISATVERRCFL